MGQCSIGEGVVGRGGNTVALHESFAERFGAFQLRSRLGGAEHPQARVAKQIHHARGQGGLWPHHG